MSIWYILGITVHKIDSHIIIFVTKSQRYNFEMKCSAPVFIHHHHWSTKCTYVQSTPMFPGKWYCFLVPDQWTCRIFYTQFHTKMWEYRRALSSRTSPQYVAHIRKYLPLDFYSHCQQQACNIMYIEKPSTFLLQTSQHLMIMKIRFFVTKIESFIIVCNYNVLGQSNK